jgi:hypothetical protein
MPPHRDVIAGGRGMGLGCIRVRLPLGCRVGQQRRPSVVTIDPVGIRVALAPIVLARGELHERRPFPARHLVSLERSRARTAFRPRRLGWIASS